MKIIKILILVFVISLVLFGCAKQEDKAADGQEPGASEPQVSSDNASFLHEVADLMVESTSNSTENSS